MTNWIMDMLRRGCHWKSLLEVVLTLFLCAECAPKPANIVLLMADDLGWNDISVTNPQVKTPNIQRLANDGVFLNQSYVLPACSPSRHALMTGRYPFRDGMQHLVMMEYQACCLPLDLPIFVQALKNQGYATHLVGKWHLGYCNWKCTPRMRGFDSHFGIYNGATHSYTKKIFGYYDFRQNESVHWDQDTHVEQLYGKKAVETIENHNSREPLFLMTSFQAPHWPLTVPEAYAELYNPEVQDPIRRTYLGMVTLMDEAIGNITDALRRKDLYKDTLIIFMSDNGGSFTFGANNFPLRGGKNTLWEGGTRTPTIVSGGLLERRGYVHDGLFHMTDWFPTFMHLAGVDRENLPRNMDGVNQWDMLQQGAPSRRSEMVYNLDTHVEGNLIPLGGHAAYRFGDYKIIWGWPGVTNERPVPPEVCQKGHRPHQRACKLTQPMTGEHFDAKGYVKRWTAQYMKTVERGEKDKIMLFNVKEDPGERRNLAYEMPEMVRMLKERLDTFVPQVARPMFPRPHARYNPENYGGVYSPGWCTLQELRDLREESLSFVSHREESRLVTNYWDWAREQERLKTPKPDTFHPHQHNNVDDVYEAYRQPTIYLKPRHRHKSAAYRVSGTFTLLLWSTLVMTSIPIS